MSPRKTTTPEPTIDPELNPPEEQLMSLVDPKREVTEADTDKMVAALSDVASDTVEDAPDGEWSVDPKTAKRPVIAKLAIIMSTLPTLLPIGRNQHFGYNFIKDTQVSGAIRPRMAKHGLMLIPSVEEESWVETKTAKGGISYVTKLKVLFTVIDADSGDSISGYGFGYGDDAGDKGANKALTAAEKYFLLKLFQIGGEDLEDDERADKRAMERESGASEPVRQVQVQGQQINGVAKGGHQDKISGTQLRAIGSIYQQLRETREWTAERFIEFIDENLGDPLEVPEGGVPGDVLNAYLKTLSGDDAGTLITALMDAKDHPEGSAAEGLSGYGD